jgi:hydroxypyruvate isomerase
MERRDFLTGLAVVPLAAAFQSTSALQSTRTSAPPAQQAAPARPRMPIRQSVMASVWGQSKLSFEERCQVLQRLGYTGMDLPTPEQAPLLKKYGLTPVMMTGAGTSFQDGLVRRELHDKFEAAFKTGIDTCAAVGCPNLIAMPGERRGMPREETIANTVAILNRVKGYAEQKGVTLCMEITNSKVAADQRTDQTFNRLDWGWEVCRRVGSPRVKIVYDIYHVQIMDGDIVRNMRDNLDFICHIHVAGVPSRQEIDGTQELNYRFIANAIAESGYTGFVAHEWRPGPGRDAVKSLEECFAIMNV